eukprot:GGOE01036283.1.p4 GENE.GGOE01036283.1~~GGOE01036283.1.p4  ORF type:complete len:130 (-),score=37.35 GGOE01036283.1:290-628(-)
MAGNGGGQGPQWASLAEEFNLLPLVQDLLRCVASAPREGSEKEAAELAEVLCSQFVRCQNVVDGLSGTDFTPAQQEEALQKSTVTMRNRQRVVETYAQLPVWGIVPPDAMSS